MYLLAYVLKEEQGNLIGEDTIIDVDQYEVEESEKEALASFNALVDEHKEFDKVGVYTVQLCKILQSTEPQHVDDEQAGDLEDDERHIPFLENEESEVFMFNGDTPIEYKTIVWNNVSYNIASDEHHDAIFNKDGTYTSDGAKEIDDTISHYIPATILSYGCKTIVSFIQTAIDAEFGKNPAPAPERIFEVDSPCANQTLSQLLAEMAEEPATTAQETLLHMKHIINMPVGAEYYCPFGNLIRIV